MSSVWRQTLAAVRRRKLQSAIVAIVVFLSTITSILALTLLVETDAPYDRAFDQTLGAHLLVTFDSAQVSDAQVRSTGSLMQVAASNGPWKIVPGAILINGGRERLVPVQGRADPGGPVDRITLDSGRWVQRSGEVVISRQLADETGLATGQTLVAASDSTFPSLTIVGVAISLGRDSDVWVEPGQLPQTATAGVPPPQYLMAYRLKHASTQADIASAVRAITNALPAGAVAGSSNYLDAKLDADRTTAVMIPFLLAFSVFALVASALIIANLVGGAVIAGIRDIGVMKSVGFTPAQVVAVFSGQMLVPACLAGVIGLPSGVLLAQPFLDDTAHAFGLPRTFGFALGPDALGLGAILFVVVAAAVLAALKAGRQSAAAAIIAGGAPSGDGRGWRARASARLPLPRPFTLGLGESLARPVRSSMTVLAIILGVATVTFAAGLHLTLNLVAHAISHDQQVQVEVFQDSGDKSGAPGAGTSDAAPLIAGRPGVARFVSVGYAKGDVPGAGEPVPVFAYREDASWLGFALINGRWFSAPGEAVAPTAFFTRLGLHIGDTIDVYFDGQAARLKLVGEIFDQQGDDILLRTSAASVPVDPSPWTFEVQLTPGTDPVAWASGIESASPGLTTRVNQENGVDTAFVLINSVLAGLALVLALIAISGVLNTVVLNTREKARDLAILKAIGMSPGQVVAMVLASVAALGLVGAALGIPAGVLLHRNIVTEMGQIAISSGIPQQFFAVFGPALVASLVGGGLVIALLGAFIPARWAAGSRIVNVLHAE